MRLTLFTFFICSLCTAQDKKISTIDFIQIVNNNKDEAIFFYQNNWKVLRTMAVEKKLIESYQLLETVYTEDAPFQLMLITTYSNQQQYEQREANFAALIKERGKLTLLNDKKPNDFRKTLFSKELVQHVE